MLLKTLHLKIPSYMVFQLGAGLLKIAHIIPHLLYLQVAHGSYNSWLFSACYVTDIH